MFSIVGAIIALGALIIVHEAGHYVVARWCRMRVDRFSLGFGPAILKWRRKETDFTLGPIPFGGFVQIHGMTLADEVEPDDTRAYPNRPVLQRFATIFAGPGTNYLFAIVLALGLYAAFGVKSGTSWYRVDEVDHQFDAAGKLQSGDRILAVDGKPIYFTYQGERGDDLPTMVDDSRGTPMAITVLRDGREHDVVIQPTTGMNEKDRVAIEKLIRQVFQALGVESPERIIPYRLGIGLTYDQERVGVGVLGSVGHALAYPVRQTELIVSSLIELAQGKQEGRLVGPVGIGTMIKQSFDRGWITAIELLMLLNVYLGLFNLLPLPALDGGRLVFLGYEMATRRRANPKVEAAVHMVGIMAILLLLVVVSYHDIVRLF